MDQYRTKFTGIASSRITAALATGLEAVVLNLGIPTRVVPIQFRQGYSFVSLFILI